jgi:hypothetical protein
VTFKRHISIFLVYLLIALLFLYTWAFSVTTHVGGVSAPGVYNDYYHFHWNFWWMRHALTTDGLSIYQTNFVLYPATSNLAFHTLTPFWYPLWALLEPLAGTLVAMFTILVLSMALCGYCTFLFLHKQSIQVRWAFAGGMIYMLTPALLLAVMLTNINYSSLFWYPLLLLLWQQIILKALPLPLMIVALGISLYGMIMTDLQHVIFAAFLMLPYGVWSIFATPTPRARIRLVIVGGASIGIALALLWLLGPLSHIVSYDRSGFAPMPIENASGINFPFGYLWRGDIFQTRAITTGGLISIAIVVATIVFLFQRKSLFQAHIQRMKPPKAFWIMVALPPLILSLGPTISIGDAAIGTPYIPFHNALGGLFRVPARFAPVFILPALVFIGALLQTRTTQHARRAIFVMPTIILLIIAEAKSSGLMPIQHVIQPYNFYETIGEEDSDYVVLEVPNAGGSGEAWVGDFRAMEMQWHGMTHEKRMLNGALARARLDAFWSWLYDDPMLAWLGQRRMLETGYVEQQLRQRITDYPIGYMIVHQDLIGFDGSTNQEIIGWFNSQSDLMCPVSVEGAAVVYRTTWHPLGCPTRTPQLDSNRYHIDIGTSGDEQFIGWGWHRHENISADVNWRWMGAYPQTHVYIDLPPMNYTLRFSAQSFQSERNMSVLLNEREIVTNLRVLPDVLQTFTIAVPQSALNPNGQNTITFEYDTAVAPIDVGLGGDTRPLAIAVDWLEFEPRE